MKFAVNSSAREENGGVLDKLKIAIQFYNSYADEPLLSREDLLNIEDKSFY